MLILSRNRDEEIQIGDDIFIKVTRIGENSVKLGIIAPKNMRIARPPIGTMQAFEDEQRITDEG